MILQKRLVGSACIGERFSECYRSGHPARVGFKPVRRLASLRRNPSAQNSLAENHRNTPFPDFYMSQVQQPIQECWASILTMGFIIDLRAWSAPRLLERESPRAVLTPRSFSLAAMAFADLIPIRVGTRL